MTNPYLGEIRFFAGNFAPRGNAYCSGQLMSIQQNAALFSLLGTFYGGNGTTTFGLPDLRGRLPIGQGQGPGLSAYTIGQSVGTETVAITQQTTPAHNHMAAVTTTVGTVTSPVNQIPAALPTPTFSQFWVSDANKTGNALPLSPTALGTFGGNQPHENRMPLLALSAIVALVGVFPSRN